MYGEDIDSTDTTVFTVSFTGLPGTVTTISGTPLTSGSTTTETQIVFTNTGVADTTAKIFYNARTGTNTPSRNVEVRIAITACVTGVVDTCGICNGANRNMDGCGVCYGNV